MTNLLAQVLIHNNYNTLFIICDICILQLLCNVRGSRKKEYYRSIARPLELM